MLHTLKKAEAVSQSRALLQAIFMPDAIVDVPATAIPSEFGASPSRAESSRPMWNQVATREPWGVVRSLAVAWYTPPSSE